jgi:hypothetical protein
MESHAVAPCCEDSLDKNSRFYASPLAGTITRRKFYGYSTRRGAIRFQRLRFDGSPWRRIVLERSGSGT